MARAFRWRRMMETGRYGTINELAAAEEINSSYVSRLVRLTLLVPQIVEAILDGRQPDDMTLPGLMEPFPVNWVEQRRTTPPDPGRLGSFIWHLSDRIRGDARDDRVK